MREGRRERAEGRAGAAAELVERRGWTTDGRGGAGLPVSSPASGCGKAKLAVAAALVDRASEAAAPSPPTACWVRGWR